MKKSQSLNTYDQMDLIEKELLGEVKNSLDQIDHVYPVFTPELDWFQQMAENQQIALRKKLRRDLLLFTLCALFILSGILISLLKAPIIFLTLQGLVTILVSIIGYLQYRKKRVIHI